jgi:hypothetical protein
MELSVQFHAPLPPGKHAGTHWIGGWVGPRARLDSEEQRKSFVSAGIRTLTARLVAIPTELPGSIYVFFMKLGGYITARSSSGMPKINIGF